MRRVAVIWAGSVAVTSIVGVVVAAALAAGAAGAGGGPGAAAPEYVRVDQLGYATAGAKRAYLIAARPEGGTPFTVRPAAGGPAVFTGTVGAASGSWSPRFPDVYPLAFDGVAQPGEYVVQSDGAVSPPFAVGPPASVYGGAIAHALSFYENERDGPDFIRSALRTAPGHLHDSHGMTYRTPKVDGNGAFAGDLHALGRFVDAAGGWWDAGDYLKFVQTTSYTATLMLAGVRDFPAEMGAAAGPSSDFTGEARFGVDWLLKMWDGRARTLYYQVGIGGGNAHTVSDHDIWRLPQADDTYGAHDPADRYIRHRPVFRAAPPGSPVSPNLAGRDAAAFGLCFQVFHRTAPRLAARCLRAGEQIFALADTHPRGHLLTAIPWGFYPETEWRDDLELGAGELADALRAGRAPAGLPHTAPAYYLRQSARWARALIRERGRSIDTLNLYDVSGLADYELIRAIAAGPVHGLAIGPAGLLADLGRQLGAATAIASRDPFGFGFPWDTEDSASHGFGLAVMASDYASLTGSAAWRATASGWLGNVLGANAWGSSLAIGDGTTFPDCPQHQVANLAGSLDGAPPVLAGAVVEGPTNAASTGALTHMRPCPAGGGDRFAPFNGHHAVFRDNVQSYSTVEPAIDLTASSPLALAWQIATPVPLPHR